MQGWWVQGGLVCGGGWKTDAGAANVYVCAAADGVSLSVCLPVCLCVRACVRACVSACERACVCLCVRACVRACERVYMHACWFACVRACMCVGEAAEVAAQEVERAQLLQELRDLRALQASSCAAGHASGFVPCIHALTHALCAHISTRAHAVLAGALSLSPSLPPSPSFPFSLPPSLPS